MFFTECQSLKKLEDISLSKNFDKHHMKGLKKENAYCENMHRFQKSFAPK